MASIILHDSKNGGLRPAQSRFPASKLELLLENLAVESSKKVSGWNFRFTPSDIAVEEISRRGLAVRAEPSAFESLVRKMFEQVLAGDGTGRDIGLSYSEKSPGILKLEFSFEGRQLDLVAWREIKAGMEGEGSKFHMRYNPAAGVTVHSVMLEIPLVPSSD